MFYINIIIFLLLSFYQLSSLANDWSGYIAGESRYFTQSPLNPEQYDGHNLSLSIQPEYHHSWDGGYQSFTFVPFARVDQHDSERTHFDIRELTWLKAEQTWEIRAGIRKVFWGVTESQHLVDIINQSDGVENPDGEDKLGQPMLNTALIHDWGTVDLFVLPYFRERTFPNKKCRLYNGIPIDTDEVRYKSSAEEWHVDWAVRWYHNIDQWDIGLSHFAGTSRDPNFIPAMKQGHELTLIPYYDQIQQTGLDVQMTSDEWLWKLEIISRKTSTERYTAATGGFEYTFVGILDSDADLGIIGEYLFDDRKQAATTPFENDFMVGMRLTLNDVQSTELLAGVIVDLDNEGRFYNIEASRRLGDSWKLSLESRFYTKLPPNSVIYNMRHEDYIQLELAWYF